MGEVRRDTCVQMQMLDVAINVAKVLVEVDLCSGWPE